MTRILTVGHGSLDEDALGDLLTGAGVELLVDVRRFPGSRNNPAVARDALPRWLRDRRIDYRWEEDLGGRRSFGDAHAPSLDTWWRVRAFRAYAAHTRTTECGQALARVHDDAAGRMAAVMCSESVWWRCHRRLIADVATLAHAVEVQHLLVGGRLVPHSTAEGARVRADGAVVWDGGNGEGG